MRTRFPEHLKKIQSNPRYSSCLWTDNGLREPHLLFQKYLPLPSSPSSGFDVLYKLHRWNRWQISHLAINLSVYDVYQHDFEVAAAKLGYANLGPYDFVRTESHVTRLAREMANCLQLNWISRFSQVCDYHWDQVRTGRPGLDDLKILPMVHDLNDHGETFSMSQLYEGIVSLDEFDTSTIPKYVDATRCYFEARGWFSAGKAEAPLLRDLLKEMSVWAQEVWTDWLQSRRLRQVNERLWPDEQTTENITTGN